MEKEGRYLMVALSALANQDILPEIHYIDFPEEDLKWCTVSLSEIIDSGKRLEASVFEIKSKQARQAIENCKWKNVPLSSIIQNAYYPGRFKRIYSDAQNGVPFYLPSQMTDIYPKPEKYISAITKCDIADLRLKRGDILLTRSGTIGSLTYVSKTLENKIFSDDVIRITPLTGYSGFIYAFLRSKIGNTLLQTNNYGSVIKHIEPEHLDEIPIPNPGEHIKSKINDLILRSFALRDDSNVLIDQAAQMLADELQLPSIYKFSEKKFDDNYEVNSYSVKLSDIDGRLDASYHVPIVRSITEHLHKYAAEVATVGDRRVTRKIILPGRFKRVYVEEGQGVVFFSGKNIMELDPSDKKYLSFSQHENRIRKQLTIHSNMILVTCSGTVGKVTIVPRHWDNWAMTHDIIRIVPDEKIEGFSYIWLQTDYAKILLEAMAYGSVVPHIEISHISQIPFPFLKNKNVQEEINQLALKANELRYDAYQLEQEAMKLVNNEVVFL